MLVRQFSSAILTGMRYMMSELLVTEMWFNGMDVSVMHGEHEILGARIAHFYLENSQTEQIYGQWQIFRANRSNFEYVSTFEFGTAQDTSSQVVRSAASPAGDSLFVDVHKSPAAFVLPPEELTDIDIVFWRKKRKKDKIISIRMDKTSAERFSVLGP